MAVSCAIAKEISVDADVMAVLPELDGKKRTNNGTEGFLIP